MNWTNAAVEQMFQKYGDRICSISLNNGKYLLIGYRGKGQVQMSDISFETIGGIDVMAIKHVDFSSGRDVNFTSYITTAFIEGIDVMDEKDKDYRIDPLRLK